MASVHRSLQCLISTLTQAGGGGLLFRFTSSGALHADIAGVCGEHSQCSSHTGFAPAHGCVLSPSTLLRLSDALYGAGPALRAVPVFRYSTKLRTQLGLRFVPSLMEHLRQPGA